VRTHFFESLPGYCHFDPAIWFSTPVVNKKQSASGQTLHISGRQRSAELLRQPTITGKL
jgi:hypothetical protein